MSVETEPESCPHRKQTLLREQFRVDLNKKRILVNLFHWRFNLDRLLRMKMNLPDLSVQITTLLSIIQKLTVTDPQFACRHH